MLQLKHSFPSSTNSNVISREDPILVSEAFLKFILKECNNVQSVCGFCSSSHVSPRVISALHDLRTTQMGGFRKRNALFKSVFSRLRAGIAANTNAADGCSPQERECRTFSADLSRPLFV